MNSHTIAKLNKDHIRRQFNRSAQRYDQVAQMQYDIATDLLAFAALSGCNNKAIADIGCGTGYGLQALADQFPQGRFTALDLAPGMLKIASGRQPNARFVLGDIESLPFEDAEFDITWSSSAIQWCDLQQSVNELARVTKPGGHVVVSTFSSGTLDDWRKLWTPDQTLQRFETNASIETAFVNAGLKGIRLKSKTYTQGFTSLRSAANSIRDLGAGNAEQDRSQGLFGVNKYRAIETKFQQIIANNGEFVLPYNVASIVARVADLPSACVVEGE